MAPKWIRRVGIECRRQVRSPHSPARHVCHYALPVGRKRRGIDLGCVPLQLRWRSPGSGIPHACDMIRAGRHDPFTIRRKLCAPDPASVPREFRHNRSDRGRNQPERGRRAGHFTGCQYVQIGGLSLRSAAIGSPCRPGGRGRAGCARTASPAGSSGSPRACRQAEESGILEMFFGRAATRQSSRSESHT
jgi:hypothetical protein